MRILTLRQTLNRVTKIIIFIHQRGISAKTKPFYED